MITDNIQNIVKDSYENIKSNKFKGYDPADLLNSSSKFIKKMPQSVLRFFTIINFYSVINFRSILKIVPAENTSCMVILGKFSLKMYYYEKSAKWLQEALFIAEWLKEKAINLNGTLGWSRIVDFQYTKDKVHSNNSTLTFINAHCIEFFLDLYKATKNDEFLNIADSIAKQVLLYTNRVESTRGICLSYVNDCMFEVPNASILAGKALNILGDEINNSEYIDLSLDLLDYCINIQNQDGSWYYSYRKGKKPKKQFDFHQTYMLDGIKSYVQLSDSRKDQVSKAFQKGYDFYVNKMFDKKMNPYWRYPIKYPIDIHNVSHAVYFYSKYFRNSPKLMLLIKLLTESFYDMKKSYFYYQKYPCLTVKHDFFRWNTAWSLNALSEYLYNSNDQE